MTDTTKQALEALEHDADFRAIVHATIVHALRADRDRIAVLVFLAQKKERLRILTELAAEHRSRSFLSRGFLRQVYRLVALPGDPSLDDPGETWAGSFAFEASAAGADVREVRR